MPGPGPATYSGRFFAQLLLQISQLLLKGQTEPPRAEGETGKRRKLGWSWGVVRKLPWQPFPRWNENKKQPALDFIFLNFFFSYCLIIET